ncbi:MAG: hypothetical protein KBS74_08570 [Clostridiales bacterium]|nr:hypothetical protein [Candidatus Cacconaster stercorequi]
MTDKELKKLDRRELLEMLLLQTEEVERLKNELKLANEALANREIKIKKSGSLASAALALNGIFEAADSAAQQYLFNLKKRDEMRGQPVSLATDFNGEENQSAEPEEEKTIETTKMPCTPGVFELVDGVNLEESGCEEEFSSDTCHGDETEILADNAHEEELESSEIEGVPNCDIAAAVAEAVQIIADANASAQQIIADAEATKAKRMQEADDYWRMISSKLEKFYGDRPGLREKLLAQDDTMKENWDCEPEI